MREYIEGGFVSLATHVDDTSYGVILDNIVVCCVDCVVVHCGKILFGLRTQYPFKGWWVMGGRMRPGESYRHTAQRVVERETGLRIEELQRFLYIDSACYVWTHREQSPQVRGCHMQGNNVLLQVTDAERAKIRLQKDDFAELCWVDPGDVLEDRINFYHPSLRFLVEYVQQYC